MWRQQNKIKQNKTQQNKSMKHFVSSKASPNTPTTLFLPFLTLDILQPAIYYHLTTLRPKINQPLFLPARVTTDTHASTTRHHRPTTSFSADENHFPTNQFFFLAQDLHHPTTSYASSRTSTRLSNYYPLNLSAEAA